MFGFKRRETPQIQLYGKLPLAKDYLRLGLGEGSGLAIRDWLDATYSGANNRENPVTLAGPMRFLAGEAWRTCLQGILVPSSDAGGLRPFPFLMCIERRRRAVLEDLQRGLVEADGAWRELGANRQRCAAHADGRSLLAALRGSMLELDAARGAESAPIDVESWLQAIWPEGGRDGLWADLARLSAVADDKATLRLPLAAGCSQRQQVLAWLEILGRLGLVDERTVPTIFFPDCEAQAPTGDDTASGAGAQFLTVLRSPADIPHGRWLSTPLPDEDLGPGDLAGGRPAPGRVQAAASEGLPPLAASLRTAVSSFLRRARGPD